MKIIAILLIASGCGVYVTPEEMKACNLICKGNLKYVENATATFCICKNEAAYSIKEALAFQDGLNEAQQ